jgi:hypothetical protein
MEFENFDNQDDVKHYLKYITNNNYSFSILEFGNTNNGKVYQLMPEKGDDGFFDWYCCVRPNNQYFKTKEICVIYFIRYWTEWTRKGKPHWKGEIKR